MVRVLARKLAHVSVSVKKPKLELQLGIALVAASEFLSRIAPLADSIHCVTIPDQPASLTAETLAAEAATLHTGARAAPSVAGALQAIASGSVGADRPVMICGSLYLAGHVLAANGTLPD